MWLKAILFFIIGVTSACLILVELPDWRTFLLLSLVIWSFCRAYYFAFYVIEHYLDPTFRYAGLISLLRHLLLEKSKVGAEVKEPKQR